MEDKQVESTIRTTSSKKPTEKERSLLLQSAASPSTVSTKPEKRTSSSRRSSFVKAQSGRQSPTDLARRQSVGRRSSKSTRKSKIDYSTEVSVIKEERLDKEQNTSYKETITSQFFKSFYSTIVAEIKAIKPCVFDQTGSSSSMNYSSSFDFTTVDSYSSVDGSLLHVKETTFQKNSKSSNPEKNSKSSKSEIVSEGTSTSLSCSSACPCCWQVAFYNGNIYEGQLQDNLMNGRGTFYWNDGTIYKGEFKNGYPWGKGNMTLPDLSIYEGSFCKGFFHGSGSLNIKSSPILFRGEWKISRRSGKGWLLYEADNWYEGDWLDNGKHGFGYRHYPNGDKYEGNWLDDNINGKGTMLWHNNDYYNGEWSMGKQQDYGEYTWNIIPHNNFTFPNYNWYKGNWNNGKRNGAGIMNFGHESGAKLAGTWQDNNKHGPGSMICGNGDIMERNPLFLDDKPTFFNKEEYNATSPRKSERKESTISTFINISKQVASKENLDTIHRQSIIDITKSGSSIKMRQFVKLLDKNTENAPPLKILIHNVIQDVNLDYFIAESIQPKIRPARETLTSSALEIENIIDNYARNSTFVSESCVNYLGSNTDFSSFNFGATASQQFLPPNKHELKNLIINYLPQLRNTYKMYALICVNEEEVHFEPVLVRIFLWQLYRDMAITDKGGISIVQVDEMLFRNPNSCLETPHSPWEPIYFWQFIQALVGVAIMLYNTENHLDYTPSSGFMYHMFKEFLDRRLLAHAGKFQGNCLNYLKDLVPVDAVYKCYKKIGEPHTVEEFIKNTCLKPEQKIPCNATIDYDAGLEYEVQNGNNCTILNNELSFLETGHTKVDARNRGHNTFEGLYAFSCLGKKKIMKSLCKICPQILLPTKRYHYAYRLSFIEFYEAILLLAFEKVEHDRVALLEYYRSHCSNVELKSSKREFSRSSAHSGKWSKKLKNKL